MTTLEPSAFDDIIAELTRQPLQENKYRLTAGAGRSQTFGIVNRRCTAPDYSRQNWCRPYLYHLLMEFGKKHVSIPYNSITVNQNYKADRHRDKNNKGQSYLVGFGSYEGGELNIHEGDLSGSHNICCNPIVTDFSKVLHSVSSFTGTRFSLVYYWFETSRSVPLPPASVRKEGNKWFFYRGDEKITRQIGLPHPLRNKKKSGGIVRKEGDIEVGFS
jgi:hypothetical protein